MELAKGSHAAAGEESFHFHDGTGSKHVRIVLKLRPPSADGSEHQGMGTEGEVQWARKSLVLPGVPQCTFDEVYSAAASPEEMFLGAVAPLVDSLLSGANGTLFTWGAPGSGKTRAIFGESSTEGSTVRGLAQVMADHLFAELHQLQAEQASERPALRSAVYASALELGGLEVVDLLAQRDSRDSATSLSRSAPFDGATSLKAESAAQLCSILHLARLRLEERRPALPEGLQRRHCIFSVALEVEDVCVGNDEATSHTIRQSGRLCFVDLAGSAEKAEQTRAACSSALADLVRVVHALTPRQEAVPVPYSASPLTQLMQDALGGNCHTVMLLTAVTGADSPSQVIVPASALQFAARVAEVVNFPAKGSQLLASRPHSVEGNHAAEWSVRQSYALCIPGEEACFAGFVPFVNSRGLVASPCARQSTSIARSSSSRARLAELAVGQGASSTLSACVEALNQRTACASNLTGSPESVEAFKDDCCVVFSSANQAYYLLYKYGRRRAALDRLGITELGYGVLTVRIVAASELRFADRCAQEVDRFRRQQLAAFVLARVGSETQRTETVLDGRHHQLIWNSQPMHFYVNFAQEDQCTLHLEVFEEGRQKHLASTDVAIPLLARGRVLRRRERVVGECGEAVLDIEACFIDQAEAGKMSSEAADQQVGDYSADSAVEHKGEGATADAVEDASTAADSASAATADAAHCMATAQASVDTQLVGEAYAEAYTPFAERLPAPPTALQLPSSVCPPVVHVNTGAAQAGATPLAGDDSVFDMSVDSEGLNVAFRASLSPGTSNDCQMLSPIPRSSALSPEAAGVVAATSCSSASGEAQSELTSPGARPPLPGKQPEIDGVPSLVRTMLQEKLAEIAGAARPLASRPAENSGISVSPARSLLTAPRDIMSASGSTLSPRSTGGRGTPSTPPPGDFDAGVAKRRSRHIADRFAAVQATLEQRTQQLNRTSQKLQEAVESASRWEAAAERLNVESAEQKRVILALERLLDLALVRQPDILDDLSCLDESSLNALGYFSRSSDTHDAENKLSECSRLLPPGDAAEGHSNGAHTGALSLRSPESSSPSAWRLRPPPPSLAGSPEVVEQSGLDPISFGADAAQRFGAVSSLTQHGRGASDASAQLGAAGSLHTLHFLPPSPLFGNSAGGKISSNGASSAGTLAERSLAEMPCAASLQRPLLFQPRTHLLSLAKQSREAPGPITSPPTKAQPSDMLSPSPNASAGASAIFEAYDRSQLEAWPVPSPVPQMQSQSLQPPVAGITCSSPLRVSLSPPVSGRQSGAGIEVVTATTCSSPHRESAMRFGRAASPPPGPPALQQQVSQSRLTTAAQSNSSTPLRNGRVPLTSQLRPVEQVATSQSPRRGPQRMMLASPLVKPAVSALEHARVGSGTPSRIAKTVGVAPIDGMATAPCAGLSGLSLGSTCLTARAGSLQNLALSSEISSSGYIGSARSGDAAAGLPVKISSLMVEGLSSARSSPPGFEVPHTASSTGSNDSPPPPPLGTAATTAMAAAAAITLRRDGSCGFGKITSCRGADSAPALVWNLAGSSTPSLTQGVSSKRSSSPQAALRKAPLASPNRVIGGYMTPPPAQCLYPQSLPGPPCTVVNGTAHPISRLSNGVVAKRGFTPPRGIAYTPPSTPLRGGQGELRLAAASVTPVRVLPPSAPMTSARATNGI